MNWNEFYDSYYYKYLLSPYDRETFRALTRRTLTKSNNYYPSGMLVVNAKIRTISHTSGISYSTTKKCLNKLEELGLIVKGPKRSRNDRFLLGFRGMDNEKYYLAWYLVRKYDPILKEYIEDEKKVPKNRWSLPAIKDTSIYHLELDYRYFMFDYFDDPAILVNRRLKDGKNIIELLFEVDKVFRAPLFKAPALRQSSSI